MIQCLSKEQGVRYVFGGGTHKKLMVSCRQDRAKAVDILVKDLKVFSSFNEELYKEITQLLTLENFRLGSSPAQ